jgi:hypothetical protein
MLSPHRTNIINSHGVRRCFGAHFLLNKFWLDLLMRGMIGRVQHRWYNFSVLQMAIRLARHSLFIAFTLAECEWIFGQATFTMWLKCPWVFALQEDVCGGNQAPPDCTQGASQKISIASIPFESVASHGEARRRCNGPWPPAPVAAAKMAFRCLTACRDLMWPPAPSPPYSLHPRYIN